MSIVEHVKLPALAILTAIALLVHPAAARAASPETLVVAGGCFWCVESDFEQVEGVREAVSGFTGGTVENPTYKQVTRGGTGHYEAVEITFDADVITRERLLSLFLRSVDITDAGGQFCDRGNSYRTAIFVSNTAEQSLAEAALAKAEADLGQKSVTPILELGAFYPADGYHQDFYKGKKLIFTRGGPKTKAQAYKFYREGCGRDQRVQELWGNAAPFIGH